MNVHYAQSLQGRHGGGNGPFALSTGDFDLKSARKYSVRHEWIEVQLRCCDPVADGHILDPLNELWLL